MRRAGWFGLQSRSVFSVPASVFRGGDRRLCLIVGYPQFHEDIDKPSLGGMAGIFCPSAC